MEKEKVQSEVNDTTAQLTFKKATVLLRAGTLMRNTHSFDNISDEQGYAPQSLMVDLKMVSVSIAPSQ